MSIPKTSWALDWIKKEKQFYINGQWQKASGSAEMEIINPATTDVLGSIPLASESELNQAVEAATNNFKSKKWRSMNMRKRAQLMRQIGQLVRDHHEELAILESLPNGKTYLEAYNDDIPDCADVFDYYSGWVDKHYGETAPVESGFLNYTLKEPVGICGLIVPWNFPLLMAMWKIAPALATGNSIVIKPSEFTPYSLIRFFEIIHDKLDLPKGLINLIYGDAKIGEAMSRHSGIHKISFTGSTTVGKKIVEQTGDSFLKSLSLELGGKSPNIIFEDVPDFNFAVERSFNLIFSQKGEKCTEPTRFIIHESIHDKFVEALVSKVKNYKIGDPLDPATKQGAQCHKAHYEKILNYIELGKKEGATLVCGGKAARPAGFEKGFFIEPTIFTNVTSEMKIFQEEIFGPVLSISKFKTDKEALELANNSSYGLAAGFWTKDISRAHKLAEEIEAGMIFINRYGCYEFSSPFGGFKQSGIGKEMGIHSLDAYTKTKSVWVAF
jgi:aldehyde dehydrogenase (NAD+)